MLFTVKNLGLEIGCNTIEPIQSKNNPIHEISSPTTKPDLMRFIGSLNFYSIILDELLGNIEPLFD